MAKRLAGVAALAALILGTGVASDARRRCDHVCVADEHSRGAEYRDPDWWSGPRLKGSYSDFKYSTSSFFWSAVSFRLKCLS